MPVEWTPLGAFASGRCAGELGTRATVRVGRGLVVLVVFVLIASAGNLQQYRGRLRWGERHSGSGTAALSPATYGTLAMVDRRAALTVGRGEVIQAVRIGKRQLLILFAVEKRREPFHAGSSITGKRE